MKWELKQSAKQGELDLYLYGDVEGNGYDWWNGEEIKSETSAQTFREQLNQYDGIGQINVYINSWGGSVFEGTAIASQLRRHQAHVTAYIDGFACSIASVIACACDEVVMYSNTTMMIHNMSCGCFGNAQMLRKMADDLDVMMEANRQIYLDKCKGKLPEEKLIEMLDAETWLTARQCLEFGLCDKLIEEDKDLSQAKEMLEKANRKLKQSVSYRKVLMQQCREILEEKKPEEKPESNHEQKVLVSKIAEAFLNFKEV